MINIISKSGAGLVYTLLFLPMILGGCAKAYYGAMEQMGMHKRDILVERVESARDAQSVAQDQFKSALDLFGEMIHIENTDLKSAYEDLNTEYEYSETAADTVSERIDKVESVAEALFKEWEGELALYKSASLRNSSKQQLEKTRSRYHEMLTSMRTAEDSMRPVLRTFRDNVLFLKHNLNAQAIGSLQLEFSTLKGEIDGLIKKMNVAIETSDQFITEINR